MVLTPERVGELITRTTEADIIDFKEELYAVDQRHHLAELVKDVIAIANAAFRDGESTGYLILGVHDKTRFVKGIDSYISPIPVNKRDDKKFKAPVVGSDQITIDKYNQEVFYSVIRHYIAGMSKRPPVVRYSTWVCPAISGRRVGILEIVASDAPYVARASIPFDSSGNQVRGNEVDISQSWIRREDKKEDLRYDDVYNMRSEAELKRREEKRLLRVTRRLGDIANRWDVRKTLIYWEKTIRQAKLSTIALHTEDDFKDHLYINQGVEQADHLCTESEWYLKPILVVGVKGSGRTSITNYLVWKRQAITKLYAPIVISRLPLEPDVEEFRDYTRKALEREYSATDTELLIIDANEPTSSRISLLSQLCVAYPQSHLWAVCEPNEERDFTEALSRCFALTPTVVKLPDDLRDEPVELKIMLNQVFNDTSSVDILQSKVGLTFQDIVDAYRLTLRGIKLGRVPEAPHIPTLTWQQLPFQGQITLKLIRALGHVSSSAIQTLLQGTELPLNTFEQMLSHQLVESGGTGAYEEVHISSRVEPFVGELSRSDIHFLTGLLDEISQTIALGGDKWSMAKLALDMSSKTNGGLASKLVSLSYRYEGKTIYCEDCNAYFDRHLRYCPNCGGRVDPKREQVMPRDSATRKRWPMLPYPNHKYLAKGTFDLSVGVDDEFISMLHKVVVSSFKNLYNRTKPG